MSDAPAKISSARTDTAEIPPGAPAPEGTWPERVPLLEAIRRWDRRLWQRLDDIVTPPGTRGKPLAPLMPSSGVPLPNEDRPEWVEAVDLLKRKAKTDGGYCLEVLDSGEPSIGPQTATGPWIETILPREVSFANSQIRRNQRVFAVWISPRQTERTEQPERLHRTAHKGGRPEKFRWDDFWIEVCGIANTPDGLPEQRELTKQMLEWTSSEWPDPPADNTIRAKIATLYRALPPR